LLFLLLLMRTGGAVSSRPVAVHAIDGDSFVFWPSPALEVSIDVSSATADAFPMCLAVSPPMFHRQERFALFAAAFASVSIRVQELLPKLSV
jgi:hypothetical protein